MVLNIDYMKAALQAAAPHNCVVALRAVGEAACGCDGDDMHRIGIVAYDVWQQLRWWLLPCVRMVAALSTYQAP